MERINISSGAKWENIVGYSRAVRIGNRVVVSGTTSFDPEGNLVGRGDPKAQTRQILDTIKTALEKAGAELSDVIRTRIYVVDITHWEEIGRIHGEFFGGIRPAVTLVGINRLVDPDMLVEIEVEAVIAEG